ncbi:MAG: hypothetical protein AB7H70_03785 [Rhodospirillaceae bacterium]
MVIIEIRDGPAGGLSAGEGAEGSAAGLRDARFFGAAGGAFCGLRTARVAGFGFFLAGAFARVLTPVLSFRGITLLGCLGCETRFDPDGQITLG